MSNMVVQTNVMALNSHRNLKSVGNRQAKANQRLSSGYRINSAADDAAGLAISEKMRAQIRGLDQASRNAQDGISLVQTAEGGMQEIDNMVQRIRELVVQASNDTNDFDTDDRQKIQDEINQLVEEIDSMSERVEFNAKKLINGDYKATVDAAIQTALDSAQLAYNTAKNTNDQNIVKRDKAYTNYTKLMQDLAAVDSQEYRDLLAGSSITESSLDNALNAIFSALDGFSTELSGIDLMDDTTVAALMSSGSGALDNLKNTLLAATGALKSAIDGFLASGTDAQKAEANEAEHIRTRMLSYIDSIDATLTSVETEIQNYMGAVDDITKSGGSAEVLENTKGALAAAKQRYNAADKEGGLYFQVGANSSQGIRVTIGSINTKELNIGDGKGNVDPTFTVVQKDGEKISELLDTLDTALSYVTTERSRLGAVQNRLEYTINSLDISSENLSASESRIRDTDMAKEMMNLTMANVLQQAATSMLAQANSAPNSVLQLLG